MPLRTFMIPIRNPLPCEAELNAFLRSHTVLEVERHWVERGSNSFWSVCVDYLEQRPTSSFEPTSRKSKVDYREVLNADDFAVYSDLRDLRKKLSDADSVPAYRVFTNEQLARIVQSRASTRADLEKIVGVGDARLEKYAEPFLDELNKRWSAGSEAKQ